MTSPMFSLVEPTIAASVAVVLVGSLRIPLRRLVGARAAYWLWLRVPLSAAMGLLPGARSPAFAAGTATNVVTDVTAPLTDGGMPADPTIR